MKTTEPIGIKIGYARTSTPEQNPALQHQALTKAKCYQTYTDVGVTGRTMHRPQLAACLKALRPYDTLVVWKLDRLGRNLKGLTELLAELEERKIYFQSLTEGIDTSTAVGRLMFHMIASLAQMESDLISERTRAGLAALQAKNGGSGAGPGRPQKLSEAQQVLLVRMRSEVNPETGRVWSLRDLARFFGVGVSTVVRVLDARLNSGLDEQG